MMIFPAKSVPSRRGISLLEVLLALVILAICALAMLSAAVTSATTTRQSAEYTAAVNAARKKMEELSACPFASLVKRYGNYNSTYAANGGNPAPTIGNTFPVYLNEGTEYNAGNGTKGYGVTLPGFRKVVNLVDNFDAGEIVIVTSETALPQTYGYSCSRSASDGYPDYGAPGGISFQAIPIDLDGDGQTTLGACYDLKVTPNIVSAVRLPVGVIIRWEGPHGAERYELWNILTTY